MKINCYPSDRLGCGHYRILQPYREIQRQTNWNINFYKEFIPDEMAGADIWVLQRETRHGAFKNMRIAQANGVKVIYELDDWLLNVDEWNSAFEYFGKPEIKGNVEYFLTYADMVTVSTEYLKRLIQPYNSNVKVYKNCLNIDVWNAHYANKKKSDCFTIGYSGSGSHIRDLDMIREDLIAVMREFPDVRLKFVGHDFRNDLDFSEITERIDYDTPDYFYRYGAKFNYDLALAPLLDTEFNRAKSNIKFLEHAIMGIPVIASDLEPYKNKEDYPILVRNWRRDLHRAIIYCRQTFSVGFYDERCIPLKPYVKEARESVIQHYNQKTNVIERIEDLIGL